MLVVSRGSVNCRFVFHGGPKPETLNPLKGFRFASLGRVMWGIVSENQQKDFWCCTVFHELHAAKSSHRAVCFQGISPAPATEASSEHIPIDLCRTPAVVDLLLRTSSACWISEGLERNLSFRHIVRSPVAETTTKPLTACGCIYDVNVGGNSVYSCE